MSQKPTLPRPSQKWIEKTKGFFFSHSLDNAGVGLVSGNEQKSFEKPITNNVAQK